MAVLIAAHCPPKVVKVTLGTWLQHYDGSYDADVYIGLHKNYHHYHSGIGEIQELEGSVSLVYVDELNWAEETGIIRTIMRFSKMHARSLQEMMREASKRDYTHVAILDHDLIFKDDLVGWMLREKPGVDMVCSMLGGRLENEEIRIGTGQSFIFAPKPSAWHTMVSRRMFDAMVEHPDLVEPGLVDDVVYDTLAMAYHSIPVLGMTVRVCSEAEMAQHVEHVWSMSLNYGVCLSGGDQYVVRLARFEKEYSERFPEGILGLLEKLRRHDAEEPEAQ